MTKGRRQEYGAEGRVRAATAGVRAEWIEEGERATVTVESQWGRLE